jgi:hypothetical protein
MLSSISWQSYLYSLASVLLLYYCIVGLLYYRHELQDLFFRRSTASSSSDDDDPTKSLNGSIGSETGLQEQFAFSEGQSDQARKTFLANRSDSDNINFDSSEQARHSLLVNLALQLEDELKPLFRNAAKNNYIKEELVLALQNQLVNYLPLKDSEFKPSVQNYIAVESENKCSIHLDAEDLNMLWKK